MVTSEMTYHGCGPNCDVCTPVHVDHFCVWCGGDEAEERYSDEWGELMFRCLYCDAEQPVDGWGR